MHLALANGPLREFDARVKLVLSLTYVIGVAILPNWPLGRFLPLFTLVCIALGIARIPLATIVRRIGMILPFLGFLVLLLPLVRGQEVLFRLGWFGLAIYQEGAQLALGILTKGVLSLLGVGFLVWTTPQSALLRALESLRLPRVMVGMLSFLLRYLDLLSHEGLRLRRARMARSPNGVRHWRSRSTGGLIGRLLLKTLNRAERVHRSMLARGYNGQFPALQACEVQRSDFLLAFLGLVLVSLAGTLGWLWGSCS